MKKDFPRVRAFEKRCCFPNRMSNFECQFNSRVYYPKRFERLRSHSSIILFCFWPSLFFNPLLFLFLGGNPFFIEELMATIKASDAVQIENGILKMNSSSQNLLTLPKSASSLIVNRFDKFDHRKQLLVSLGSLYKF